MRSRDVSFPPFFLLLCLLGQKTSELSLTKIDGNRDKEEVVEAATDLAESKHDRISINVAKKCHPS